MSKICEINTNPETSLKNIKEDNAKSNLKTNKPLINTINSLILSILIKKESHDNNKKRNSVETAETALYRPEPLDYNLNEIKKFDEFDRSLSDISEFDLEKEEDDNKSDFNSSEDDNNDDEEEIIVVKSRRIIHNNKNDTEFEIELEKEYDDIIKELNLNKESFER